jgi:hypothetical protein
MNIMLHKICENIPPVFNCVTCHYKCSKKSLFVQHNSTAKHINATKCYINATQNIQNTCLCGKNFKHHSSYYRHKKVCNKNIQTESIEKEKYEEEELTNNKDELIKYLINENKEFKNLILEIVKKDTTTNNIINNNNNTNSHNKTFNLQFFLNETCKDAMNMSDFINSLTLQLSDLESVGKLGFVDGISNIIIKNLEALDVEKRPVHCCDSKRETMYIKDQDKWEKDDNEMKRMKELVRYVRDKNISMVNIWRDLYPECVKSNSKKTTQFNEIYMESFGGEKGTKKEKEEKIISRIAKAVIIDKHE